MKPLQANAVVEQATEFGGRVTEMADGVRAKMESVQEDMSRNFRRAKVRAEDLLDEGRQEIKSHPYAAVSTFLFTGLAVGFAAGMLFSNRKRT